MTQLTPRLERLAASVLPGEAVADIATDHARLAIALVRSGRAPRVIASDVAREPLAGARQNVREAGVEDRVELRLGDGLETLADDEVATVVIAGVGGVLCRRMLAAGVPSGVKRLVLQVNSQLPLLRGALAELGWDLVDEAIDLSDGRFFITLIAEATANPTALSATDLEFGPHLRRRRPPIYLDWLERELQRTRKVVRALPESADNEAAREARRRLAALEAELGG